MWQDLLPERWDACDDRQAALEASTGLVGPNDPTGHSSNLFWGVF